MGISRGALRLMAMTLAGERPRARVVTFGVQKVEAGRDEIRRVAAEYGFAQRPPADGPVSQAELFQALGYQLVDAIDYYPDEGPSIVHDLNRPLPQGLPGTFDLVYDGGTLEHCFDPAQVLRNAAALAAPGGTVIHHVPMNNWVDHGFYQFSPTLFFDYYGAAGFVDLSLKLHFMIGRRESYADYDPRRDPTLPYALGGRRRVLAFFAARRPPGEVQAVASLVQGRYRATFGGETDARRAKPKGWLPRLRLSLRKRLIAWNAKPL